MNPYQPPALLGEARRPSPFWRAVRRVGATTASWAHLWLLASCGWMFGSEIYLAVKQRGSAFAWLHAEQALLWGIVIFLLFLGGEVSRHWWAYFADSNPRK